MKLSQFIKCILESQKISNNHSATLVEKLATHDIKNKT
jgi:hypothetical protein